MAWMALAFLASVLMPLVAVMKSPVNRNRSNRHPPVQQVRSRSMWWPEVLKLVVLEEQLAFRFLLGWTGFFDWIDSLDLPAGRSLSRAMNT